MSYHQRIMNIPAYDDAPFEYKEGHRDARHAAAEIASEADAEVERLRARELNALRLLLMAQHNWDWSVVCGIDIDRARDMTRTSAPLTAVSAEGET